MIITSKQPLGISTINHKIRKELNLNLSDYVVLDFLYQKLGNKATKSQLTENLTAFTGEEYDTIYLTINAMWNQGKLVNASGFYKCPDKFIKYFESDVHINFEKLWEMYGKVGNKSKAKEMYLRALKEVSHEHIASRVPIYLNFIQHKGTFQQHMSTWLNPKHKEFDNEYQIEVLEETEQEQTFL